MSGIAGYLGSGAGNLDAAAIAGALSFTGKERISEIRRSDFLGMAISHGWGAMQSASLLDAGGTCAILDGHISDVAGVPALSHDPASLLRECLELFTREGPSFAKRLNGSFSLAVYEREEERVHLFCDRLSTRPLFYIHKDGVLAFASRLEPFFPMGLDPAGKLNPEALLEFLVFGHLFAAYPWPEVREVPAGTALSFHGPESKTKTYWKLRFTYDDNSLSVDENAERLAGIIREAVGRAVAGSERVGLLLSGGLDSRTLLACLPEHTICYTLCDGMNFEARTAATVARIMGRRHVPLLRSPHHYLDMLPEAARMGEGFLEYHHAYLGGLYHGLEEVAGGVVMAGNAMDVILRECCLPRAEGRIRGRRFHLPALKRFRSQAEVVEALLQPEYIVTEAADLLGTELRRDLASYPHQAMRAFVEECSGAIADLSDVFQMVSLRKYSRWITVLNVIGLRHRFCERIPGLDNAVLDLGLSIPPQQRFGSHAFVRALSLLNPRLAWIPDANTFLPGRATGVLRYMGIVPNFLYNRLYKPAARRTWRRSTPPWLLTPGPWHNLGACWTYGPISARLEELLRDEGAMRDGVIDPGAVRGLITAQRNRTANNFYLLTRLISFLEWRRTCP